MSSEHDGQDTAALVRALGAARKRAFLCESFQATVLVLCGVALVFEVVLVTGRAPSPAAIMVTALVLLATGLAAAAWRTPSLKATAAHLDRHFDLADRLVTALECRDRTDAFSRLVIRDATRHVGGVAPREAFRVEWPRAAAWAAIVAMVVPLAAVFGGTRPTASNGFAPGSTVVSASTAGRTVATPAVVAGSPQPSATATAPRADQSPRAGTPSPQATQPSDLDRLSSTAPLAAAAPTGLARGDGAAAGQGGAPRSGRGKPSDTSARAGDTGPVPDAPVTYAAAWASAESAAAPEHVPARRRPYVRRYLDAIRQDHP